MDNQSAQNEELTASDQQSVTWTASEYVHHEKSAGWYFTLTVVALILVTLIYLLTKDVVSVGVVIVAALLLGIYATHQPRQLEYKVDQKGLSIGDKRYTYGQFKSFSIMSEGAFSSIVFMPLKRFAQTTTIYFPPDEEEAIMNILANHLPLEEARRDAIDSLMRRIRF